MFLFYNYDHFQNMITFKIIFSLITDFNLNVTDHLIPLTTLLWDVRSRWYHLGIQLNVDQPTLEVSSKHSNLCIRIINSPAIRIAGWKLLSAHCYILPCTGNQVRLLWLCGWLLDISSHSLSEAWPTITNVIWSSYSSSVTSSEPLTVGI